MTLKFIRLEKEMNDSIVLPSVAQKCDVRSWFDFYVDTGVFGALRLYLFIWESNQWTQLVPLARQGV